MNQSNRFLLGISVGAVASLVACGTPATNNNPDSGIVTVADMTTAAPQPDLIGIETMGLEIGPIHLDPGQERTVCSVFKLGNTAPIDIIALSGILAPGSHHLIFYKSKATVEKKDLHDCQPLDIQGGDIPIYIAETETNNTLPLPPGVAYHLEAGEMVKLEAHYLNATGKELQGMGAVTLTVGPSGIEYQKADIMFCGSVSQLAINGVPPGMTSLNADFYRPPAGVKVFGLTTHQHKRGTLMEIEKATGKDDVDGTNLTMGKPYDNPPFVIYKDPNLLTFEANEGFRWTCHYNNTGDKTYRFGQSAEDDEMCFLWAYYYPSVGRFISTECAR